MDIQVKRGVEANRASVTPKVAEPIFTTDEKELYIGDGTTPGGIPVGTVKPSGSIVADAIALFKDTTGKVLYAITKSDFLKGYATEQYVANHVATSVPAIEVDKAKVAAKADDADALKGRSDYLIPDIITDSYQEDDTSKVVSASGIKSLWTSLKGLIDGLSTTKLDKTDVTSSLASTSTSKALSAAAGKTINDKVGTNATNIQTALTTAQKASQDVQAAKASGDAAQVIANEVKVATAANKAHLDNLPSKVTKGTAAPTGGSDGDVYLQYK